MYPILFDYSTSPAGMLPLFFPACKFLQPPVHVLVGSLTRPVGAHDACYDTGQCEEQHYQNPGFHMIRVPCIRPSTIAITIADANMPNSIQNRSMLVPSQVPEVEAHLHQAQQGQCDQYRQ